MKQVLVKKGMTIVDSIPAPIVEKGYVLVKVVYSCISVGTELSGVKASGESLLQRLKKHPQHLAKGLNLIKEKGLFQAREIIKGKFELPGVTGYSASGIVIEVGSGVTDLKVGDRVACAGAGYANHADLIEVPRNLVVRIPGQLDYKRASTVTLGSIAMQGVRRADARLGEYVVVIGMGVLGQLAAQIATAAGARVIAIDLDERRLSLAKTNGVKYIVRPSQVNIVEEVIRLTDGYGADSVIIAAATDSKEPLAQAFQMCRKRGRVVLVGVVGMEIDRNDIYKKELDFLISTSYGPGRYDIDYEERGLDYPYHYVRWTENRNLEDYLRMIEEGKINLDNMIEKVYDIEEAPKAYDDLKNPENKPLMVLLKYEEEIPSNIERKEYVNADCKKTGKKINVALVGVGSFAKGVHLPNLQQLKDQYNIYAIMSRTGHNSKAMADQYNAKYSTTDYNEILNDPEVDMVLISTRHDLHAQMSIQALRHGKAVFVEKPMALNEDELDELINTIRETRVPFMVGFNRRFSKYAEEAKRVMQDRINPIIVNYRMNAGYIPLNHWVHTEEGGGRIVGEGCHIFDLFSFFTGAELESVSVDSIDPKTPNISHRDNVVMSLKYADGSICTLTYTSVGNKNYPKEMCEIFFDGKVITIEDYKKISGFGVTVGNIQTANSEKGHLEELLSFAMAMQDGKLPISLEDMVQTTRASFMIEKLLTGETV